MLTIDEDVKMLMSSSHFPAEKNENTMTSRVSKDVLSNNDL